jgi:hypothetical protein
VKIYFSPDSDMQIFVFDFFVWVMELKHLLLNLYITFSELVWCNSEFRVRYTVLHLNFFFFNFFVNEIVCVALILFLAQASLQYWYRVIKQTSAVALATKRHFKTLIQVKLT